MATPKKWTKKDINSLCSQIDSFWLFNRDTFQAEGIARVINENRQEIVLRGLRGFRNLITERGKTERSTVEHAKTSGVWGKATESVVERFTKLADESDKSAKKLDQIIARVEAEGLPQEALSYLPEALRK